MSLNVVRGFRAASSIVSEVAKVNRDNPDISKAAMGFSLDLSDRTSDIFDKNGVAISINQGILEIASIFFITRAYKGNEVRGRLVDLGFSYAKAGDLPVNKFLSSLNSAQEEFIKPNYDRRKLITCLLYTSPSPRDQRGSRMPSSA